MRILCIDEDSVAVSNLQNALKKAASVVDQAQSGQAGIELIATEDYDAVVLEMRLPDMDGLEVIRTLREAKVTKPILVVAASVRHESKVRAFGLGADDYLAKPYDPDELVARLQAITRRTRVISNANLQVGPLRLDLAAHQVWANDAPVRLTGKEFAILDLLMSRKGAVLTKEAFIEHLYNGMDVPEIKIIDVFICKLRKKLDQFGVGNLISTVWGRGYALNPPDVALNLIANVNRLPAIEAA